MWLEEVEVDRVGVRKAPQITLGVAHCMDVQGFGGSLPNPKMSDKPYPLARSFILIKM